VFYPQPMINYLHFHYRIEIWITFQFCFSFYSISYPILITLLLTRAIYMGWSIFSTSFCFLFIEVIFICFCLIFMWVRGTCEILSAFPLVIFYILWNWYLKTPSPRINLACKSTGRSYLSSQLDFCFDSALISSCVGTNPSSASESCYFIF
jgi:hypothetical protein